MEREHYLEYVYSVHLKSQAQVDISSLWPPLYLGSRNAAKTITLKANA